MTRPAGMQQMLVDRPSGPGVWCYTAGRVRPRWARDDHADRAQPAAHDLLQRVHGYGDGSCIEVHDESNDPDGQVAGWDWNFGAPGEADNTVSGASYSGHCYSQPGTYTVTLTVTDDSGAKATDTRTVEVAGPQPSG